MQSPQNPPPTSPQPPAPARASAAQLDAIRKNVPADLIAERRWVAWDGRLNKKKGKVSKAPLNPNNGEYAQSNSPTTWSSFEDAAAFALRDGRAGGLAFALQASGYWALDLDHVLDIETGVLAEPARRLLNGLSPTYAERSISRDGLHVIYSGDRPAELAATRAEHAFGHGRHLEVFGGESGRFLIMTGEVWDL